MRQKIKSFIIVAIASLTFGAPALVPALAGAGLGRAMADNSIQSSLCQGVNNATSGSQSNSGCTDTSGSVSLSSLATKVVNFLSIIVGIVAVIMIIIGGFRYITSGGESGNVSGAKNTLIYAIVGLVIVALAQFIVHFVLQTATSNTSANSSF